MKKDILFLLQFFYPEYISSATLPFDTALKLVDEGYSVDVLCGYPHEYTEKVGILRKETVSGINIRRVKYLQLDRKRKLGRIVNYLSLTVAILFHIFSMRKYKIVVVYSNPPILPLVAAWASKLFRCKLIFVAYDLYPEIALKTNTLSEGSAISRFMRHINQVVYRQASAVVALSSEMKAYMMQNRDISPEKIHIIPNWYQDEYRSRKADESHMFSQLLKDRFVIGYFGNMGIAQDMEPLKGAMRYYKNDSEVSFLLSGHGAKHGELQSMIEDEKIENAHLYGFLKGQDYLNALSTADCAIVSLEKGLTGLCVPSKTYGYMMQGLPIVAIMDDSDIVTDIHQGAGYQVAQHSADALIDIIREMKNDLQACRCRGKISRKIYLENYTPEICLEKYAQLLSALLSNEDK